MTDPNPDLQDNRFERMAQRISGRRVLLWLIGVLISLEIACLGLALAAHRLQGLDPAPLLDKYMLTRWLVSPFALDNPAERLSETTYLGPWARLRAAAAWRPQDAALGWRLSKGVSMAHQPNPAGAPLRWRMTNDQGFAPAGAYDYHYAVPKPAGTFRILIAGASAVEGDGAETPLMTLPAKVQAAADARLKAKLPPEAARIEVINAGVGGYSSAQVARYLETELLAYEPDLVVAYGGPVDMVHARNHYDATGEAIAPDQIGTAAAAGGDQAAARGQPTALQAAARGRPTALQAAALQLRFVADELATVDVLGRLWTGLFGDAMPMIGAAPAGRESGEDVFVPAALEMYRHNLRRMADAAAAKGVPILFALDPIMTIGGKPLTPEERVIEARLSARERGARATYFEGARAVLSDLSEEHGGQSRLCVADLSRAFAGVDARIFVDTWHVFGVGNTILADKLVDALIACGFVGKP